MEWMLEAYLTNAVLAVPLLLVCCAAAVRRTHGELSDRVPAAFLATLTAWVAVLLVEQHQSWWTFADGPTTVGGMPMELSLGWALCWGALPVLAGGPPWAWLVGFAWVDLSFVSLVGGLQLHDGWLVGEALLLAVAAAPALLLGWTTLHRRWLWVRVGAQVLLFTALFGWLLPALALAADGLSFADAVDHSYLVRALLLTAAVGFAVPALSAVVELGHAGGTPFPWDPPTRLVTTGPYAYLANPMQVGAAGLLALLALATGSPTLLAGAVFCVAFSLFVAEWHERATLTARWEAYADYRAHVRNWRPRWTPYVPSPATLWVSESCGLCSATGATVRALDPVGLECRPAEGAPQVLRRMTWTDGVSTSSGTAAFARAIEHSRLPLAWLGWWMRLPGVDRVLQLVGDACGLGPRALPPQQAAPNPQEAR